MPDLLNEQITLRKLEVFAEFMKTENIGRTAEALQTSSVSVHRSLHSLEEGLGCPLFVHKGRSLLALATAKELNVHLEHILRDVHTAVESTRRLGNVANDHMRLGTLYSLTVQTVPQLIAGTKFRRPNIEFELQMGSNEMLLNRLSENQLDAIIIDTGKNTIDAGRFEVLPLYTDKLYLVVPAKFKLAGGASGLTVEQSVDLKTLKDQQFITLSDGFATFKDFQAAFAIAKYEPNIVTKVKDIFSVLSMVQSGLGLALLPGRMCRVYESAVHFLPLNDRYQQFQNIGIVFDRNREHEPNLLALVAEGRMFARRVPSLTVRDRAIQKVA